MPPRRRYRRSPQLTRYNIMSRWTVPARQRTRKMFKRPQKLRLIRRYIRDRKTTDKQSSFPSTHGPGRVGKPNGNLSKPFGFGRHEVVPEMNSIPNPIPDTGSGLVSLPPGSPLFGAIRDTSTFGLIIPPTPPPLPSSKVPPVSFSALPPLQSSIPSVTSVFLIDSPLMSPAIETILPKSPNVNPQTAASKTHSVNLAVIILLAVGSALLLLGSCVLIKICTRTRRKDLPKPSLPIFEDADPEDDFFEAKESPIFGGKERVSPMPGPNGAGGPGWTWIQYPHARLAQPAANSQRNSTGAPQSGLNSIQPGVGPVPADGPAEPPLGVPTAIHHALRRQSMHTASIYSPRSCADVAQAITHDRLTTVNGDEILTRSRSAGEKRRSQLLRGEEQRPRDSTTSTIGLAYDGEYMASPSVAEFTPVDTPVIGHIEGRERIKSGYLTTGPYPMVPNTHGTYSISTATRVNVGQRNSFSKDKLQTSNSKQRRSTHALSYALGLATPDNLVHSPQPTLYPEDSMSVVDIKTQKKRNISNRKESVPGIPVIIPRDRPALNSRLTNTDFRMSRTTLSEFTMEDGSPTETPVPGLARDRFMPGTQSSADIPPRVPSPPSLPTLSQMALGQHHPEPYASPTYSLYGLYETSDRRSIMPR